MSKFFFSSKKKSVEQHSYVHCQNNEIQLDLFNRILPKTLFNKVRKIKHFLAFFFHIEINCYISFCSFKKKKTTAKFVLFQCVQRKIMFFGFCLDNTKSYKFKEKQNKICSYDEFCCCCILLRIVLHMTCFHCFFLFSSSRYTIVQL